MPITDSIKVGNIVSFCLGSEQLTSYRSLEHFIQLLQTIKTKPACSVNLMYDSNRFGPIDSLIQKLELRKRRKLDEQIAEKKREKNRKANKSNKRDMITEPAYKRTKLDSIDEIYNLW
jgi:hypothetical protein